MPFHKRLLQLFLIALLSPFLTQAQSPQQQHDRIISALAANDSKGALATLSALRDHNPQLFKANNYDYLLGRLTEQIGDLASAQTNLTSVAARKSPLSSYAVWHLARIARNRGDLVLERETLRQFITLSPDPLLREAALLRLGESFRDSGDFAAVIPSLKPLTESASLSVARKAQLLTAQALFRTGKTAESRSFFTKLLMQMPDASRPDDFALEAVRGLDAIDAQSTAVQISDTDRLLRASVYQFNRDFDGARNHYLSVITQNPMGPTAPNAIYQVGRGYYLQQRFAEALKYFERVANEFPESESARDALAFAAGSHNRMKHTDEAVAAYKLLIARFPDAPNPERPFLNIIDALHEAGRYQEALSWVQQTRTRFAGQLGSHLALFAQTRIHLAQGDWTAVIADTEELTKVSDAGGTRVSGGATADEVKFLRALALEQSGKIQESIDVYLSLPDGRNSYHGQRATARLAHLALDPDNRGIVEGREKSLRAAARQALTAGNFDEARRAAQGALRLTGPAARTELLEILRQAYRSLPAYDLQPPRMVALGRQEVVDKEPTESVVANELLFLGLPDEGVPAYLSMQNRAEAPPAPNGGQQRPTTASPVTDSEYTIGMLALRGGIAKSAVRVGERLWRSVPADYVMDLAPREMVDLLYPVPHREAMLKYGPSKGLDPRFLIAIARQESRFDPEAKSVAAARGMLQFIPETANKIANQLGKTEFQQDELYNPDTAIEFGAQYLANLFQQFPAQPAAVAASYNGGEDNMARWVARSRSTDPDRYVSEIGFSQTKDYVFRVMTNLTAYQRFYNSNLQRQ